MRVPTLLIHGADDDAVAPRNAEQLAEQICALAGVSPGTEDGGAELKESSIIAGGRRCQVRDWSRHGDLLVRLYLVEQLGHAWSGGHARLPFNDPAGPDASRLIWEFVARFRRSRAVSARTQGMG
jgi:poly(3-hydroxybutyrate) depolymerase